MQFQVPQFIEVEDKIIGPLTGKQFFYLLGGAAIIFLLRLFLDWWAVVVLGGPFAGLAVAMAFLKVNGVPFIKVMGNAFNYFFSDKLYLWKKRPVSPSGKVLKGKSLLPEESAVAPKLTEGRLQDLAWSLDIQHKPFRGDKK